MNQDESSQTDLNTNQPIKQPVTIPSATSHDSRKSKRKTILVVVCVLMLIALIGGLGYILMREYSSDKETSSTVTQPETAAEITLEAERVVNELETKIVGELQRVDATTEYGGTGSTDGAVYATASYQAVDQEFAVYPASHYGLGTISTADTATGDMTTVESYLTSNGFVEVGTADESTAHVYASENTVCAVRLSTTETSGQGGIGIGCGDMSDYNKNYQDLLPFYSAYVASKPESTDDILISSLTIKDGQDGYKNATLGISSSLPESYGGFVGFFYFIPTSSAWIFLTGAHDQLPCDLFSTSDLKKAFSGQECYSTTTNSSVKIDYEE